jgi:hypothetical protein
VRVLAGPTSHPHGTRTHRPQIREPRQAVTPRDHPAREEYRQQHAALEAALDVLDRFPVADADGTIRSQIEAALQLLLRRTWPYLDDLDDSE